MLESTARTKSAINLVMHANRDFLPFKCQKCGLVFCQSHRFVDHGCSDDPSTNDKEPLAELGKLPCGLTSCGVVDILNSICPNCKLKFCLKHRHGPDHGCITVTKQSPKVVKAKVEIKSKKQLTPAVQLMKLKMSAKGDKKLTELSKVYLLLIYNGQEFPLFYDKVFRLTSELAMWQNCRCTHERVQIFGAIGNVQRWWCRFRFNSNNASILNDTARPCQLEADKQW
jgi:predicted nucleic acid binding AN1-type Zn finger protein